MNEPDNLVLDILRKMQADMVDLKKDNREIKEGLARVERQVHDLRGDFLRQAQTLVGLELRIERIETRLELQDS